MRLSHQITFFLVFFVLVGCREEKKAPQLDQQKVKIPLDFYAYTLPLKEDKKDEEIMIQPPEPLPLEEPFPEPVLQKSEREIHLEGQRRELQERRAWRQQNVLQKPKLSSITESQPRRLRLKDKDYSEQKAGVDMSSLPVDRDRVLTEDMIIPLVLERAINSQLPGRVTAITPRDVLSPTLKNVLLPAYTRFICTYESLVKEGDTRLSLLCHRAILPSGASIFLTNAAVADQMGRMGAVGSVDNRLWQKYGAAFMIAGISALASAGSNGASMSESPWAQSATNAASNLSAQLGQITAKVLDEKISLAPIMTIAAGSLIHLIPATDIWLKEALEEAP